MFPSGKWYASSLGLGNMNRVDVASSWSLVSIGFLSSILLDLWNPLDREMQVLSDHGFFSVKKCLLHLDFVGSFLLVLRSAVAMFLVVYDRGCICGGTFVTELFKEICRDQGQERTDRDWLCHMSGISVDCAWISANFWVFARKVRSCCIFPCVTKMSKLNSVRWRSNSTEWRNSKVFAQRVRTLVLEWPEDSKCFSKIFAHIRVFKNVFCLKKRTSWAVRITKTRKSKMWQICSSWSLCRIQLELQVCRFQRSHAAKDIILPGCTDEASWMKTEDHTTQLKTTNAILKGELQNNLHV